MKEIQCPSCGYRNPDIRELGYRLPWACGKCPHIWRLQDLPDKPLSLEDARRLLAEIERHPKESA
jgi:hypothetical protein